MKILSGQKPALAAAFSGVLVLGECPVLHGGRGLQRDGGHDLRAVVLRRAAGPRGVEVPLFPVRRVVRPCR